MSIITRLIGLGVLLAGLYFLGQNIYFTTNPYPYWWRGIAADSSILALTAGIFIVMFSPRELKVLGYIAIGAGIFFIFVSSKAILNPTSLWQFCLSVACLFGGYQLLTSGRLNI